MPLMKKEFPNEKQTQLYDIVTKLETRISKKVNDLKKNRKQHECEHFEGDIGPTQTYNPETNYYEKFWKSFLLNELCLTRLADMQSYLDQYTHEIFTVEDLLHRHNTLLGGKAKRKSRRTADEIEKRFHCSEAGCMKSYGSQVSLNLHIKLKHHPNSINKNGGTRESIRQGFQSSNSSLV